MKPPENGCCFFCYRRHKGMQKLPYPKGIKCRMCQPGTPPHDLDEHFPNGLLVCCNRCNPASAENILLLQEHLADLLELHRRGAKFPESCPKEAIP